MEWHERNGVPLLEAALPRGRAFFSTRAGGVSEGAYATLNLGLLTGDDTGRVRENRRRLAATLDVAAEDVLVGLQVHGAEIKRHRAAADPAPFATFRGERARVDGHATDVPGLVPLVLVADCLPVALSGPGGVAMLHCGWRGLAGGIIERGAEEVAATAAAIGPGIGPCCFEVGTEVLAEFTALGDGIADGRMLDLPEVATRLLRAAGITDVSRADLCTSCDPERFFSHRRDRGETGRQAGAVVLAD